MQMDASLIEWDYNLKENDCLDRIFKYTDLFYM